MSTKRILLNKNDTGFGLSKEAHELFLRKAGIKYYKHTENFKVLLLKSPPAEYMSACKSAKTGTDLINIRQNFVHHMSEIPRDHPVLWDVAQEIGLEFMNDRFSKLAFVNIPAAAVWTLIEIKGVEYLSINPNSI